MILMFKKKVYMSVHSNVKVCLLGYRFCLEVIRYLSKIKSIFVGQGVCFGVQSMFLLVYKDVYFCEYGLRIYVLFVSVDICLWLFKCLFVSVRYVAY